MGKPGDIHIEGAHGYRGCTFCRGRGCLACAQQSERDRQDAFDHPLFMGDPNNSEDLERLRALLQQLCAPRVKA